MTLSDTWYICHTTRYASINTRSSSCSLHYCVMILTKTWTGRYISKTPSFKILWNGLPSLDLWHAKRRRGMMKQSANYFKCSYWKCQKTRRPRSVSCCRLWTQAREQGRDFVQRLPLFTNCLAIETKALRSSETS
jgi:hypothetical protein